MDQSNQTEQAFSTTRRQDRRQAQRAAQQNARANQPDNSLTFKDAATFVAEMTPVIGDVMAAKEVYDELQKDEPNYYLAGALGGAAVLGLVPGVGDAAAQAVKKGAREVFDVVKRLDVDTNTVGSMGGNVRLKPKEPTDVEQAAAILDDPDALADWQTANKIPENKRQSNPERSKTAADDLYRGDITSKEARRAIREELPEPKLYTPEDMPEMPSVTDVAGSLGKKVQKTGVVGVKGFDIPAGTRVGSRLDIPAYNNYDKWVVSIHDGKNDVKGSVLGYGQAVRLKNIKFGSESQDALDIARGKGRLRGAKAGTDTPEKPMGKATIARVYGDYVPEDPYVLQEQARNLLSDPEWTQVGMNPYRQSNFYNKETGKPVFEAEEVIQVGPLVLAKGVKEPTISQLKELAVKTKDGGLRLFNQGGALMPGNTDRDLEADYEALRSIGEDPKDMMPEEVSMMDAAKEGGKLGVTYLQLLARKMGFDITPTEDNRKGFSEGGSVMEDQMARVMQSGGLADDGMNQDPVSGNDIPSGSLAEEVRDDIPAQLSEGEYVVPADVVRYYGVRYFEDLRDEAKEGLTQMEDDGRIGGEPVMPEGITEEDLAQLDEMVSTGMANGGLLDKLSYAAQNDPTVNQMLNQGGMTVGFSEGGMTQSLYSDPTQIDQVINQVMQAARDNPGIMEQLASRGIQINRTEPQMPPQTMDQANPPPETRQAMFEGGLSSFGTQSPEYITSQTGISPMFAVPGGSYTYAGGEAPAPVEAQPVCGEGYTYDEEKKMCVPVSTAAVKTQQSSSGDSDGGYTPPPTTGDGEGGSMFADWGQDLDFTDPDSVLDWAKDLSEPMKGSKAVKTGAILAGGPLGLAVGAGMTGSSLKDISDLRAAALIAEAKGDTKLAESLNDFADDRVKASSGIVGMLDDIVASGTQKAESYAQRLGYESLEEAKEDSFNRSFTVEKAKAETARKEAAAAKAAQAAKAARESGSKQRAREAAQRAAHASAQASLARAKSNDSSNSTMEETMQKARDSYNRNKAAGLDAQTKAGSNAGSKSGYFAARGGLMKKPKK